MCPSQPAAAVNTKAEKPRTTVSSHTNMTTNAFLISLQGLDLLEGLKAQLALRSVAPSGDDCCARDSRESAESEVGMCEECVEERLMV